MNETLDHGPRVWLTDLVQTDPSAERLARLVGLGRVEGVLLSWRSTAGDLAQVRPLAQAGWDVDRTSDALAASDARLATGLLLPQHERTNGRSGFVAVRLPPGTEAAAALQRAGEIVRRVNRPNVVIGFACDAEGLLAARSALTQGQHTLVYGVACLESLGTSLDACVDGVLSHVRAATMAQPPLCLVIFDPAPVTSRVEALLAAQAERRSDRAGALAGRTRNVLLQLALAQVGAAQAQVGEHGSIGLVAMTTCGEVGLSGDVSWPAPETPIGVHLGDAQTPTEEMAHLGLSAGWELLSTSRAHLEGLASLGISVEALGCPIPDGC